MADISLFIQAIGLLGTVGGIAWPLFRRRSGMLVAQAAASFCFTVHYTLIGAVTAGFMNLLSSLQAAVALPLGERPEFRKLYLAILPVIAVALAVTWNGLPSAFAAGGTTMISLARYQTDVVRLRLLMLCAMPLWFAHNALVGSVPGMISDICGLLINLAWLFRHTRVKAGPLAVQSPEA